ncbi:hypothetical protein MPSEU_000427600 [Mayamaea pseudoterrestris]|nr:hypothetical protein MPSEU_000427600 [Mayamaea pseudoterrestris]
MTLRRRMILVQKVLLKSILVLLALHESYSYSPSPRLQISRRIDCSLSFQKTLFVDAESIMDQQSFDKLQALISKRLAARNARDYVKADALKQEIDAVELPTGFRISIEDVPYSAGGGSTFKLCYKINEELRDGPNILQLAHIALGMAVSHAERNIVLSASRVDAITNRAKQVLVTWRNADIQLRSLHLGNGDGSISFERYCNLRAASTSDVASWCIVEEQLSGRKAADAAYWFALAGSRDEELFDLLTQVCTKEVRRFGCRPSCQLKDLTAICDKLAAAGVRRSELFEETVATCVAALNPEDNDFKESHQLLALHGESCAYMIWKFASRQRKQKSFLITAAKHWESQMDGGEPLQHDVMDEVQYCPKRNWHSMYTDPTRPLVVDLGCGMGLSLLGLAGNNDNELSSWHGCNFVGADLSSLAIRYASGIAARWKLENILQFIVDSAEQLLSDLEDYPGPVHTVLVQFPTPYQLQASFTEPGRRDAGNSQLPTSVDDGFMVTPALLEKVFCLLQAHHDHGAIGKLIIQSNCEDVALWIYDTCCRLGYNADEAANCVMHPTANISQRTSRWLASGGSRAIGFAWSSEPLLPKWAWTETEVACDVNDTPVHRCLLRPPAVSID